jgi:hypothetical protein
MIWQP